MAMTRDELLALPTIIDLPTLARALDVSEPTIRERYRRGELDRLGIRVIPMGTRRKVVTADVLRVLGIEEDHADGQVERLDQ